MKLEEQNISRNLRREGKSMREIELIVKCSRGSISRWVKDIELTEQQRIDLFNRNPINNGKYKFHLVEASKKNKEKHEKIRATYREEGFKQALKLEPLHVSVCMLYWAEGAKSRYTTRLINSDVRMLKLFLVFLQKYFEISADRIAVYLNCYTDIHDLDEIKNHWLSELNLPKSCLRKPQVNCYSSYSKKKRKGKCEFGTCTLQVLKGMKVFEHIMGALEFYKENLK